jgi:histidinol-phosphate aminotransferase
MAVERCMAGEPQCVQSDGARAMAIKPLEAILQITPYKGGDPAVKGTGPSYKLSANENPLGCSAHAQLAFAAAVGGLALYPDGASRALREAIGALYSIDPDRIVCGSGSDEIFQLLARAFLAPGDEIIQTAHAFLVYRLVAQQSGAVTVSVAEPNLIADVDAILAALTPRTRIVFLANPNNPTGSYLPKSELYRLHAGLPEDVLLVIDGAYAEYVLEDDYDCGLSLALAHDNVMITRTFSKIYGLAALRLGWCYGPESVIDALNRVRGPFNVSAPALAAGVAALKDQAFVQEAATFNARELARLKGGLGQLGLTVYPSVGNFLLIAFPEENGRDADAADAFFRSHGLVLRGMKAYGLGHCLRLSVGTVEANDRVLDVAARFVSQFPASSAAPV